MSAVWPAAPGVLLAERPPPRVQEVLSGTGGEKSAYIGVRIDHAVNLLESRAHRDLDRPTRLHAALVEQQQFIGGLLTWAGRAAFDLRTEIRPDDQVPISCTLLARTWGANAPELASTAELIRTQLAAGLPGHVAGSAILSHDELLARLDPYRQPIQVSMITKRELTARPSRPDAGVRFYFSISSFNWVDVDWNPFLASVVESGVPVTVSIGLFPVLIPGWFRQSLTELATWYGRLAREDEVHGGLYYGTRRIPPDAFAVQAERILADNLRRWAGAAFLVRIQLAAPRLAPGVVESLAGLISPADTGADAAGMERRSSSGCAVERASGLSGSDVARWNLAAIDCYQLPPGGPSFWDEPDAPPRHLRLLRSLGDSSDAACAFRLPIALEGTVPGFRVRRGRFGHAESYRGDGQTITLGRLSMSEQPLRLPTAALTRHALIAGSTGSGKTTTVLELLVSLWRDHRIPFLVIEPVNADADDYRRLLELDGFDRMSVLTVGDERGHPLRFNPFQVPQGVLVGEHVSNLLSCFKAAFGLWEPLPSIYQEALDVMYLQADILTSELGGTEPRRWPTVIEFANAMDLATSNLGYAGDVKANIEAASIRRARQLSSGSCASTFFTDRTLDLADLLSRPIVVELKSLGSGDDQSLMIALLLNAITEHYKANWPAAQNLRHVTVVEEAHRLLARPHGGGGGDQGQAQAKEQAAADLANVLAENRKYGEGMIIAEQIPTKLVEDAIKNTNLKIMHRLTAERDREELGRSMGFDEAQERFAARLGAGEALAYSDAYAEAVHIEIDKTVPVGIPAVHKRSSPPFDGCTPCRAKCEYRGASLALLRDLPFRARLTESIAHVAGDHSDKGVLRQNWDELLALLRSRTMTASALPSTEPDVSDAAFCLFLHGMGADGMDYSPVWPSAMARRLGIEGGDADE